ncbi:hypothetical protein PQX77_002739 [Marasmius sp. AFHP31]|nr:hypothetical protein PQX77_002739 [Marasmius sp. AFHP31]
MDLNETDTFVSLWQGKIKCYGRDSKDSWDWVVLTGKCWELHGEAVARCVPFLPVSFGRAPRDPAQKINSGYKAWEYCIWFYELGPALLRGILPEKYWRNYCQLVRGLRIAKQYSITYEEAIECNNMLCEFVHDFEDLYVQRNPDRIHFVRQSIHVLPHLIPETFRVGPLTCYAQWVMETIIGNLGSEIGSLVDPFTNIENLGVLRAQLIALYAILPEVAPPQERLTRHVSRFAYDLGNGYSFLPKKDRISRKITSSEAAALDVLWRAKKWPNSGKFCNYIRRRGKLLLPNGQKVRSVWNEELSSRDDRRRATIVKFEHDGRIRYGEVHYFFLLRFGVSIGYPLAMVSVFSEPDQDLLKRSHGTVHLCNYEGHAAMMVIGVKEIKALVAMVPDFQISEEDEMVFAPDNRYFLVEKPSIQGQEFCGLGDLALGQEDDDDNGEIDESEEEVPGETDVI